jgi:hypothetical protein
MTANTTFDYVDYFQQNSYYSRALFYLLTPRETYFENAEDVPDVALNAYNAMMSCMLIEQLVFLAKHGRFTGRINDSV